MAQEKVVQSRFKVAELSALGESLTVLELGGQLDAHTAWEFERFLERVVRNENKNRIILDFHDLEYISSAGLGVLMGLIEEVRASGGDIKLAIVPEKIYHVLDLLGFPMVFQIFPNIPEAKSSFETE
jgi:anti-sigma B factor antagonist